MPVHIGELSSQVDVLDGDLPLTPAQVDKLVAIVCKRLKQDQHETRQSREATQLRRQSRPTVPITE